jgi:hypothetical protein
MAPEVQDLKNHRKTAKVETHVLSQWNRWVAIDFFLDQNLIRILVEVSKDYLHFFVSPIFHVL